MHQNYVKILVMFKNYHLVRRLKNVIRKICTCCVKKVSYKKFVEKIMHTNYKYHKNYAEKLLPNSYIEKLSCDCCLKIIHMY